MATPSFAPSCGFFSLPTELRQMIYDYLIPTARIPIDKYIIDQSDSPWNLLFVSREFHQELRLEISARVIISIQTRIIPLEDAIVGPHPYDPATLANLSYPGPPIQHLIINRNTQIQLLPCQPKAEQELKKSHSCLDYLEEHDERVGDWRIRWICSRFGIWESMIGPRIRTIKMVLADINSRAAKSETAITGLSKENVVRLVAAYRGSGYMEAKTHEDIAGTLGPLPPPSHSIARRSPP
ncbi:MAG: hypothetical protein Q9168_007894 [Polycauliona sp. 1 TL-2023]